ETAASCGQHGRQFLGRADVCGRGSAWSGRQVLVGRGVAKLGHQVVAAALVHELGDGGAGIAEIAEVPGRGRAGRDARGYAARLVEGLVVDLVDAERAFLHHARVVIVLASTIGAGPGAELATDTEIFVDEH